MRKPYFLIVLMATFAISVSTPTQAAESLKSMAATFKNIPDSQKLAVYWYWMSDNISQEGVRRDLEAMKRAGINRAYIGNIGESTIPYGKVKLFSPEWWNVMHTALKTAGDLGIEIGIFNSPGWSQSGGPWIKPERSMRYLASKSIEIEGGRLFRGKLPEVGPKAQDVRVVTFPTPAKSTAFSCAPAPDGKSLLFTADRPATVRSLVIRPQTRPQHFRAQLFLIENSRERLLRDIDIDRSNPSTNVGFVPYAPVVVSLPATIGQHFRLSLSTDASAVEQAVLSATPLVERYAEKSFEKMFQTPQPLWGEYMWAQQPDYAGVAADKVVDITSMMQPDGTLVWKAPKGHWTVMRTAMLTTGQTNAPASPEGTGLEVDKMSREHVAYHFDKFIGEILRRIPAQDRRSFKVVVEDSYETGGQNWTDSLISQFTARYGYSPVPYLPVLSGVVVGNEDISDRFLWDLRRFVADQVAYEYVGGLREVSHRHGLTTWLENYGHWGFPSEFLLYGSQSDEVAGEFWSVGDLGNIENRCASSCAHIYGKAKVWAESFTCGGPDYSRYPAEMKKRGDRFFTEGINSTLLHVDMQQPDEREPGINAPYGNEFNRHNTWFGQLDVFARYLKRCNYLLQQGQYIADAAYFIGEDAPKMTGIRQPELPRGYSFDYINADVLLHHANVMDGKLVLDSGMKYSVLVLPPEDTMRPELLARLQEMVADGLVVVGRKPLRSPSLQDYPEADMAVANLANSLWNAEVPTGAQWHQFGKGRIYTEASLEKVFADLRLKPDFTADRDADSLLFIHRRIAGKDAYFVSNQTGSALSFKGIFRSTSGQPELWNPQTATVSRMPQYSTVGGQTTVPMRLEAFESAFIVFDGQNSEATEPLGPHNYFEPKQITEMDGPWSVKFDAAKGGPAETVKLTALSDWAKSTDKRIRYYSGTALYTHTFKLRKKPTSPVFIDLGKVMVMAKVKVNGQYAGGVWTAPYRLDVTKWVKKGKNTLEVEVVNNWRNKLIEQEALPKAERVTWHPYTYLNKDSELQESGLLGPVRLMQ